MLQFSILTIGTFVTMLDSISIFIGKACFKKDIKRIVPILSLTFGLILGIAGYYTPNVDMGRNLIEAIFIGLSAGAAATGAGAGAAGAGAAGAGATGAGAATPA